MGWFSKLLSNSPQRTIEHPVFGTLSLNQGKKASYWLHEVFEGKDDVSISIEAPSGEEPTHSQVQFYEQVLRDLDAIVNQFRTELAQRHKEMHGVELPSDWKVAFKLAGLGVPIDGDRSAEWDLTLESLTKNSGFLYNLYFNEGKLERLSVDT